MTEFDEDKFIRTMKEEGREEGKEEGQNLLGKLMSILLRSGRQDDAIAASEDPVARAHLMKEFGLNEA